MREREKHPFEETLVKFKAQAPKHWEAVIVGGAKNELNFQRKSQGWKILLPLLPVAAAIVLIFNRVSWFAREKVVEAPKTVAQNWDRKALSRMNYFGTNASGGAGRVGFGPKEERRDIKTGDEICGAKVIECNHQHLTLQLSNGRLYVLRNNGGKELQ